MAFLHLLRFVRTGLLLAVIAGVALLIMVSSERRLPSAMPARAAFAASTADCRAQLDDAGVRYTALAPRSEGATCGYADGVRWETGGAREAAYDPVRTPLACPLASALARWEWDVVQPAAARLLGAKVVRIDHFGSYACRRMYGRTSGGWSEHARGNAFDVAGFRLADGRRITVAADWTRRGREAAFLRAVRDGACTLFATTLSPDYNEAHRDHFHLDQAARGGWGACR